MNKKHGNVWEAKGPLNTAGRTLTVAVNPLSSATIYAGSASGGLWRSRSLGLGKSWEYVETGHPVLAVSSICFNPQDSMTMYIGTGEVYNIQSTGTDGAYRSTRGSYGIGILKSEDGGNTWSKSLDWSYNQQHGVWMIKVDPQQPKNVYAATTQGLYKSTNAGNTWVNKLDIEMGTDVEISPTDPKSIVASFGNFNTAGKGIYYSEDGGETWSESTFDKRINFNGKILLDRVESQPDHLYASIGNGFSGNDGYTWLLNSTDGGKTWNTINETDYSKWQGWFSHDVAVNPRNPNELITVGIEVYKSTDRGKTLEIQNEAGVFIGTPPVEGPDGNSFYVHSDIHFVDYHPDIKDLVIFGTDGGVFVSYDGASTFRSANGGYQTTQFYNGFSVSHTNSEFAMGGLQDNSTVIYRGEDAWQRAVGGDGSWTAINQQDNQEVYASAQFLNLFKSTDNGNSFVSIRPPLENNSAPLFISPYVLAPSNPQIIYTGSSYLHKSSDGGRTWSTMNNGVLVDGGRSIFAMDVSTQDPNVVYIATVPISNFPGILSSSDGGNSWTNNFSALPARIPNDIVIDPSNDSLSFVCFSGFGSDHLYYSQDRGRIWSKYDFDLPDVPGNAIAIDDVRGVIYYGTDLAVYFAKYREGSEFIEIPEWKHYNDGLPKAIIAMDLKISPLDQKLWVATHGNGSYNIDLIDPLVSASEISAMVELNIYPNPSSDFFNIDSELELINWELFSITGELINTGQGEIIPVQDFDNGSYIIKINFESDFITKEIIISR